MILYVPSFLLSSSQFSNIFQTLVGKKYEKNLALPKKLF